MAGMASAPNPASKLRHVRPVAPVIFPASEPWEEHLGQSPRHLDLCIALYRILQRVCAPEEDAVACDQYVYWRGNDRRRCLAPDAFVKLGVPDEKPDTWKTWERGVPELAVEVLSPSDTPESLTFAEKLERYAELGVRELVCFDLDAPAGERLRVWDRLQDDLVERVVEGETTPCVTLGEGFTWVLAPFDRYPAALRLERNGVLVPTAEEAERAAREAERAAKEAERAAKEAAEARVRELEAILRERG